MKPVSLGSSLDAFRMKAMSKPQANPSASDEAKLEQIKLKFKLGGKLTREELRYLETTSPDLYQKVIRIMALRKTFETQLYTSRTKEEASAIMTMTLGSIKPASGDDFDYTATANQLSEAYKTYLSGVKKGKPHHQKTRLVMILPESPIQAVVRNDMPKK